MSHTYSSCTERGGGKRERQVRCRTITGNFVFPFNNNNNEGSNNKKKRFVYNTSRDNTDNRQFKSSSLTGRGKRNKREKKGNWELYGFGKVHHISSNFNLLRSEKWQSCIVRTCWWSVSHYRAKKKGKCRERWWRSFFLFFLLYDEGLFSGFRFFSENADHSRRREIFPWWCTVDRPCFWYDGKSIRHYAEMPPVGRDGRRRPWRSVPFFYFSIYVYVCVWMFDNDGEASWECLTTSHVRRKSPSHFLPCLSEAASARIRDRRNGLKSRNATTKQEPLLV